MTSRGTVLLVDDEEKILKTLGRALRDEGHEVFTTADPREAQRLAASRAFDVLVIDYRMPGMSGLELAAAIAAALPEPERPVMLMMTAHGTVNSAVEAMKLGVRDYLQKPFDIEDMLALVRRGVDDQRARHGLRYLLSERDADFGDYGIVGRSRPTQDLIRMVGLVARSRSTVLITGETGTGKELVARAIHNRSAERSMPLIKVNCAAIPDSLLESELFGHVRGAFTGALQAKKGRFALADGGTIFLDEIGTLSLAVQAKLLRVLQEREFEPLGSERTIRTDVRVVAATNRNLASLVAEGHFLSDLYYRLNVLPIVIQPLRERRADIPILVQHFVARASTQVGKSVQAVAPDAMAALEAYDWPGNVRELENTIERAVILSQETTIERRDVWLMPAMATMTSTLPSIRLHDNLAWTERETVARALAQAGGVKKDAAELMGISQRALSHYLAKHRLG
jgi:two-component system response regulator AtoC